MLKVLKNLRKIPREMNLLFCEYEYDIHWHTFKHLRDVNAKKESDSISVSENDWDSS